MIEIREFNHIIYNPNAMIGRPEPPTDGQETAPNDSTSGPAASRETPASETVQQDPPAPANDPVQDVAMQDAAPSSDQIVPPPTDAMQIDLPPPVREDVRLRPAEDISMEDIQAGPSGAQTHQAPMVAASS